MIKVDHTKIMEMFCETDLLGLIRQINTTTRNSGMEENMMIAAGKAAEALAGRLNCSPRQAVIFSIVFNLNFNTELITLTELAGFLSCEPIDIAAYTRDLEALADLRLIKRDRVDRKMFDYRVNNLSRYYVPSPIIQSVCEKNEVLMKESSPETLNELLVYLNELLDSSQGMERLLIDLSLEVTSLILDNHDLPFARTLISQELGENSLLIVCYLSLALFNGHESTGLAEMLKEIVPDARIQFAIKRQFEKEEHELLKKELVCFVAASFKGDLEVRLTEKFAAKLFEGEQDLLKPDRSRKNSGLILYDMIPEKQMFYSIEAKRDLQFLEEALLPDNFGKLMKKLQDRGLPQGMNVLLYGPPGTGKTETVFQLARRTGRDIRQIDISETKSHWFGDSEKLIKQIFDQYRYVVDKSTTAPILLFNEADGIFTRRKATGKSSTDQTENAIQNIILQEMENLRGIMIATTNMAGNIDKAFERRFLYKILFEKPDMEARLSIWKTRLPELDKEIIKHLSERFDFSGGQIDNIARKYVMHHILRDKDPFLHDILAWCREEGMQEGNARIGFRVQTLTDTAGAERCQD
ncbi:MAG: ATP-binding protein [Bacteroidales bacterium]|nr:ATP-binding protein [Bacteroidales bacterium]